MSFNGTTGSSRATTVGRLENFYPSPFFDVGNNYMPRSLKEAFPWCSYYQQTHPLAATVTNRLATYPITDLVYETDNAGVKGLWQDLFERILQQRTFTVEMNLDRYTLGNAFCTVRFPFRKMLLCPACGTAHEASTTKYKWKNYQYHITCQKCSYVGASKVRDEPEKAYQKIKLIRWNPASLDIEYNEITGTKRVYYRMPPHIRNQITLGNPDVIETVPAAFIDAVRLNKAIKIDSDKIFHARRPSISRDPADAGWGAPLLLPVLKDLFFTQILLKSQEAVALEHIVPMRILFPQVSAEGNNVFALANLQDWQREVREQVSRWKMDPNYIPILPFPVGFQMVGGQGKTLLLHQELRVHYDQIIAGMGIPTSFVYGEAQYSGASVNLRALENEFLGNRDDMMNMVNFIRDAVARFMDWPLIGLRYKQFKMADDIQRASFELQLANAGMISRGVFLQNLNYDADVEEERTGEEYTRLAARSRTSAIDQAEAQGQASLVTARYQGMSQQIMQEYAPQPPVDPNAQQMDPNADPNAQQMDPSMDPNAQQQPAGYDQSGLQPGGGTMVDMLAMASGMARQLRSMDEVDRNTRLESLRAQNPDIYMLVIRDLKSAGTRVGGFVPGGQSPAPAPLPEVLPPRAGADRAQL